MKKDVVFIICFFFVCGANAQITTLQGVVTDNQQYQPLSYVTLIAKPTDKNESMKFGITDDKGYYKLELIKNISYVISVSSLGFEVFDFRYVSLDDLQKDIELIEDVNKLETVVIEMPIVVKKDTLIYNTDKFVTGEERKLKDVLEKLPGIVVNENGSVTSNGEKITHLLVEGKKFFGGNSKLAVENIPANSIDKVEVIDDYNEIAFLKGMTRTENMAMNIKLKEGKKNFVFGDVEAGKGNENYYRTHANLFYYRPKFNFNFIGGLNNIGEKAFTFKDYDSFIGKPSSVFSFRDYNIEKNTISQDIESSNVIKSKNNIAALNFTRTLNDKLNVSSYLIISKLNDENFKEDSNQYLVSDLNYNENVVYKGSREKALVIGKFNLAYAPNKREQWYLKMLAKKTDNLDDQSILSITDINKKLIENSKGSENTYLNGNLEWHKKLSQKHAFSTSSNIVYNKMNSDAYWNTNQPILENITPIKVTDFYRLKLLRKVEKKDFNAIFKHYWTINNYNLLNTTIGNKYSNQYFYSDDSQLLENETTNDFTSGSFGNDLNFKLNDFYIGVYSNIIIGKLEFIQSVYAHNYSWTIDQNNFFRKNKWVLLPDFSLILGSHSSGKTRLYYGLNSSFSNISKLASNYYLQSYNSVYKGNEQLENELYHFSKISYSKTNLYRGLYYLYAEINYSHKINGVINSVASDEEDIYLSSIMAKRPSEALKGSLIMDKRLKIFKYKLKVRFSTSRSKEEINSNFIETKNTNGSYNFSVQTRSKKFPIIKVGFRQSMGINTFKDHTYKYTTSEPFITFNYNFLKKYIFFFDYKYYKYQNKSLNVTNTYNLTNAKIVYDKKESSWRFSISANNLFDMKFKNKNSLNTYIVSETKTYVIPRIFMFSLAYKL